MVSHAYWMVQAEDTGWRAGEDLCLSIHFGRVGRKVIAVLGRDVGGRYRSSIVLGIVVPGVLCTVY